MRGKHYHEEWSFKVEFAKVGRIVRTRRFIASDNKPFLTEEEAREEMNKLTEYFYGYIQKHKKDGDFDSFAFFPPVCRIVTEWDDETQNEEVRK